MTSAVLPIKTFARAKSRLGGNPGLAEAMAGAVLRVLTQVESLSEVLVVTREPRARALAEELGAVVVEDADEAGHSAAALLGIAAASSPRVLLVPGDCPLLDPAEVDALLAGAGPGVTIVPDRHGTGTNALVLDPPGIMAPSFGPGSCARHAALARAAGVPVRVVDVPSLAFDVDTPADLAALAAV